mmetsp:Transcript_111805/g.311113  ORF Transcript_111805/g.311113 Transcript_111805/m.311113 type:complete len:209 (+) Transcript_111805:638-1264(+)
MLGCQSSSNVNTKMRSPALREPGEQPSSTVPRWRLRQHLPGCWFGSRGLPRRPQFPQRVISPLCEQSLQASGRPSSGCRRHCGCSLGWQRGFVGLPGSASARTHSSALWPSVWRCLRQGWPSNKRQKPTSSRSYGTMVSHFPHLVRRCASRGRPLADWKQTWTVKSACASTLQLRSPGKTYPPASSRSSWSGRTSPLPSLRKILGRNG